MEDGCSTQYMRKWTNTSSAKYSIVLLSPNRGAVLQWTNNCYTYYSIVHLSLRREAVLHTTWISRTSGITEPMELLEYLELLEHLYLGNSGSRFNMDTQNLWYT